MQRVKLSELFHEKKYENWLNKKVIGLWNFLKLSFEDLEKVVMEATIIYISNTITT